MIMCRAYPQRVYLQGHPRVGIAGRTHSRAALTLSVAQEAAARILDGGDVAQRMRHGYPLRGLVIRALGHEIEGMF